MILRDLAEFYTRDPAKMLAEADLMKSARDLGEQLTKLAKAPMGDNYTGPVLFEGVASAQIMAELLGRNLHISRKPVTAQGRDAQAATDLSMRAELLTWSRSRGVFAGIDLNGVSISQNAADTDAFYGSPERFGAVLHGAVPPPPQAHEFLATIRRYFGDAEMHH